MDKFHTFLRSLESPSNAPVIESISQGYKAIFEVKEYTFYHGTDSPPFKKFNPHKASKGDRYFNPLGDAMYVTDKESFAKIFGKYVYEVKIPKDIKIKRVTKSNMSSVVGDILRRSMKKVGIDFWADSKFDSKEYKLKRDIWETLNKYVDSAYDTIIEGVDIFYMYFPEKGDEFSKWIETIANQKFKKFDIVIFSGTNEPECGIDEKCAKEILIFNKDLQKIAK